MKPGSDEARELGGGAGLGEVAHTVSFDFRIAPAIGQARRDEGEQYALAYLARLHAGTADPDELARALGVRHA